ncbi:carboxyl-terminal processing protease [Anaerosolibacter carboniphilus]|uniref:Carboxyl-terminal processing protease n=1 Tax=Anaerosolibacter carboniphilus TaxID=1417629 RepID=A0A841KQ43_9FIRM|nr:S41 family peptidase [Anaerosolibacter carboniphilus]MBB6215596.1 carboxyl-terminal processing protease [Anaerosolibacter carboniphilus]
MAKTLKQVIAFGIALFLCMTAPVYGAEIQVRDIGDLIQIIEEDYFFEVSQQELLEGAMRGIFYPLDPYSNYFSKEEYDSFDQRNAGSFAGIGVTLSEYGGELMIDAVIQGGPAARAGLEAGDTILSVDGKTAEENGLPELVRLLKGEPQTKVKLSVRKLVTAQIVAAEVTREVIHLHPVTYKILENNIGYIKIDEFIEKVSDEVEKAVEALQKQKVKGIVIDVRNNPGGILDEAVNVADIFLPKNAPVVYIEFKDKSQQTLFSRKEPLNIPLAVLVNQGSASASEILAAAIQENKAGTVIGTTTYGKGTVQMVNELTNGGGIKLTIARYLTPKKNWIHEKGVTPDVVIENPKKTNLPVFAPLIEEKDYALGEKGLNVYGVQQRLNFLGYKEVIATGSMDGATTAALKDFQEENNLSNKTGVLNIETRDALNNKIVELYIKAPEDLQLNKAMELLNK